MFTIINYYYEINKLHVFGKRPEISEYSMLTSNLAFKYKPKTYFFLENKEYVESLRKRKRILHYEKTQERVKPDED